MTLTITKRTLTKEVLRVLDDGGRLVAIPMPKRDEIHLALFDYADEFVDWIA